MLDPGTLLSTTHQTGDGLRVRLRLCRPSDAQRVTAFLAGLSGETRRRRFNSTEPDEGHGLVRQFTFYDPRERLVVAATCPVDGTEAIVGIADVALLATGLAELSVVVDDDVQGHGIGTLLVEAVASLARRQGATRVKAELHEDNPAMLRLMEHLGETLECREDGASVVYTTLPAATRAA